MRPVFVLVFHAPVSPEAGPLVRAFATARVALAGVHRTGFLAAGAADVRIIVDAADRTFGERLRHAVADLPARSGAVILGSGSIPLAGVADRRRLVAAAAGGPDTAASPHGAGGPDTGAGLHGAALANNRYSGDVVALPNAPGVLAEVPDLPGDNALPRWLAECAGLQVADLRDRWWLQADLDGLADLALLARSRRCPSGLRAIATAHDAPLGAFRKRLAAVEAVGADLRAELVVTGRISADGLAHLERATACRVRALVEERGLRAASRLAQGPVAGPATIGSRDGATADSTAAADATAHRADLGTADRPPASVLGMLLEAAGPAALGPLVARLGDAAVVDTRVLLAHARGADERAWPVPEDRLASDLLLPDRIADPWLRTLTESAVVAPVPILLGGHSLVGPGLRLLFPAVRRDPSGGPGPAPVAGSAR